VNRKPQLFQMATRLVTVISFLIVAGCASPADQPKPIALAANVPLIGVQLSWTSKIGAVDFPLDVKVAGNSVFVADSDGTIAALDARTGTDVWRTKSDTAIVAGVGSDGRYAAVINRNNEVVVLERGRELWRQKLGALSFTAPLVADRSVTAFDAQSGRKLWSQPRAGEPLVLRQGGVILAVGDTLVVGLSGRLVGMNPQNGTSRWEVPVATPRGTNDVERLVDLVAHVSRDGDAVCVRAFQAAVSCVDAASGTSLWTKPASGSEGVHGDGKFVYGTESDGKVVVWRRADGERVWESERLKYRSLTAPLVVGRSVAIGDGDGAVHLLSREDGAPLNRISTDGSAIKVTPVLAGETLVIVTRNGGVFGFKPE
jgi:outer membrane protein assembly factor BamB